MKKGRFSRAETDYIRANARTLTVEKIALQLDRSPETVQAWIGVNILLEASPASHPPTTSRHDMGAEPAQLSTSSLPPSTTRAQLRSSIAYKQLKEQFTEGELRYFEERYVQLVDQFREDITATEEVQVHILIKLEIMMDRNLKNKSRATADSERLARMRDSVMGDAEDFKDLDEGDRDKVVSLEEQIASLRSAQGAMTSEWVKLEEKHQSLMKDLKATRDQRMDRIESSKQTFLGLLRELDDEEARAQMGRFTEIMRRAGEKELVRLSAPHKYENGEVDQPILNADTSMFGHTPPAPDSEIVPPHTPTLTPGTTVGLEQTGERSEHGQ